MPLNVNVKKNRLLIAVSGDMTIPALGDIREAVQSKLSKAKRIEFDLSQVEDMDSAGVQFLFAVRKMAESKGMSMTISAASPSVRDCLGIFRMEEHFGINND